MQWSDLGRGRLEKIKVQVRSIRISLELALAIPQRGTRMSMDVNWPLLCQSMAGQQDTQWAVVSGWKEWEADTRKPWKR